MSKFVVGAGAGGENDRIARAIQHALTKEPSDRFDDRDEQARRRSDIAINYLASKKGDGNTIGLAPAVSSTRSPANGSTLHKQFTPLIKLFDAYQAYFTATSSPIKSMIDVRDRLKADPSGVTFRVSGRARQSAPCLRRQCRQGRGRAGDKLVTVVFIPAPTSPRRRPAVTIDVGLTSIGSPYPLIEAGKLRMLGIAAPERLPGELAKYPTVREQGLDVVTANSYTVLVPNGLRARADRLLEQAVDKVLDDPDFKKDLALNFWVPRPIRYPDTVKWMQDDYDENRAVLKELGMLQ